MKRFLLPLLLTSVMAISSVFAQEGTKQLMPSSSDRLWLEFNVFEDNGFGIYGCDADKRINIRMKAGEKAFFGMKLCSNHAWTYPKYISFRVKNPNGNVIFSARKIPSSGTGYIQNYTQATAGPNGAVLNGTTITEGYTPYSFTADVDGDYYIEFQTWDYEYDSYNNSVDTRRFALEYFDVTVTDASNKIITNPGEPNKSAGRLWAKSWQMTTASFTEYPINAYFYVYTEDAFINKN